MSGIRSSWRTDTYERASGDTAHDTTLRVIGDWHNAIHVVEQSGRSGVCRTLRLAMEMKFGDVSCSCAEARCDGMAGHDNWGGKEHYKGLYLRKTNQSDEGGRGSVGNR